jgi:hypothetical protein
MGENAIHNRLNAATSKVLKLPMLIPVLKFAAKIRSIG